MILTGGSIKIKYTDKELDTISKFSALIEEIADLMEKTYNTYSTPCDDFTQEDIELIKCFVNQMDDGDTMSQ